MPRKGSRKLEVDGDQFLWRTRVEDLRPNNLVLTVQKDEDKPGRVLQLRLRSTRYTVDVNRDEHTTKNLAALTPEDVREAIRLSLKKGWNPSDRGAAFTPKGTIQLPEFETAY